MGRILIADPSESFCAALARRLPGYEIHTCHTGNDTIALLASFSPDILVINLCLPRTDGLQVLRQLRNRVPTIALTPILTQAVCDAAAAHGVDLLVAIPCSLSYLETEIHLRLSKKVPSLDV